MSSSLTMKIKGHQYEVSLDKFIEKVEPILKEMKQMNKDGFGRECPKEGWYYCASCGNMTYHNKNGVCENTEAFRK